MAEKNIIAFFKRREDAEQALNQIKQVGGIIDSSIDNVDGYPGDGVEQSFNPLTGNFPGLGYLTLGGDFQKDAGILAATSVSASGMSSGGPDNKVTGYNICLTVVMSEEKFHDALQIVQKAGAIV